MCTLAAIFSAAAWAQAVPEPAADLPAVVVTGTRIQRGDDQPAPQSITTVAPDELLNQGDINLGEALNELPALRATFGQANSSRFIGTALSIFVRHSGSAETFEVRIGGSMPGCTEFTRMLSAAYWTAADFVMIRTAPLDAL